MKYFWYYRYTSSQIFEGSQVTSLFFKMKYKIPEKVFNDFEYIGGRNYSTKDHKHIETFAYLIGEEESSDEIVVKELLYPDQYGQPCYVNNTGMILFS